MRHTDYSAGIVVSFAELLALGIRLGVAASAGFPLNDGGLFYAFIMDILAHGFSLPSVSSYNTASIPLAYPPLAFYLAALLHVVLRLPVLQLLLYVPSLLSVAAIPAFYFLAREMLGSTRQAALAAVVFSLLPRTFDWLIMGGGITRALGLLLALLVMGQLVLLFTKPSSRPLLPTIILGGLLVCSHPEATVHTAITALLLYLWKDRSRAGLGKLACIVVGIVAVSAPWWALILARHGLEPFMGAAAAAGSDSYHILAGILALFRFDFTDEPFLRILGVLGLLGLAVKVARRDYFLAAWFILMHGIEPRGASLFVMLPLAMAAGFGLDELTLPALGPGKVRQPTTAASTPGPDGPWLVQLLGQRAPRIFLGFLVAYSCMSAYLVVARIRDELTLSRNDLQAFSWVQQNTVPESRFALVTRGLPLLDATSEWFPALTNRRSIATVFGSEWLAREEFALRLRNYESLQACAAQRAECLEAWRQDAGESFDYIYVRTPSAREMSALFVSLVDSGDLALVYSNENVAIFKR